VFVVAFIIPVLGIYGYRDESGKGSAVVSVVRSDFREHSPLLDTFFEDFYLVATMSNRVVAAESFEDQDFSDGLSVASDFSRGSLIDDGTFLFNSGVLLSRSLVTTIEKRVYTVASRDTIAGIAKKFGVSTDSIYAANPVLRNQPLRAKQKITIVVSVVKPSTGTGFDRELATYRALPVVSEYFIKPVDGVTDGSISFYNAVDFTAVCDTNVVASADGVVIPDASITPTGDRWNNGYGEFVFIEHQNGTKTRYTHLSSVSVSVGDIVKRGQVVGLVGKTGNASACQLGFEVYGARNPFARY
jgi:murein DD-endopeptidase MepM/ murein hydrolase activator NlpD